MRTRNHHSLIYPEAQKKRERKEKLVLWIVVCIMLLIPAWRIVAFPLLLRIQVDRRRLNSVRPLAWVVVTLGRCVVLIHEILIIWIGELRLWLVYGRNWGKGCSKVGHRLRNPSAGKLLKGARLLSVRLVSESRVHCEIDLHQDTRSLQWPHRGAQEKCSLAWEEMIWTTMTFYHGDSLVGETVNGYQWSSTELWHHTMSKVKAENRDTYSQAHGMCPWAAEGGFQPVSPSFAVRSRTWHRQKGNDCGQ